MSYEPIHSPGEHRRWQTAPTLVGRRVRLEPLSLDHVDDLAAVGLEPAIWRWTLARPTAPDDIRAWVATAIANRERRLELPFATVDIVSGRAIGSTRFLNIVPEHRRLEIGWTWVGHEFQRTGANREAKLLQLTYAFETLGANRVEFKTDARNEASRNALLGIGATFEGIFRDHMVMPEPPLRHSAYYSVIRAEWPGVRERLEESLRRSR
jgi:RimJ/RimL family protein N-acetyltransferase